MYHLNGFNAPPSLRVPGLAGDILDHGYLAVDLFFVLSGYVMALSYGEMLRVWSGRGFLRFLIRRIARVYPLYLLITLFVAGLMILGVSHEPVSNLGGTLAWNLVMLQGWGFADSLDGPAWSVSTEWGAYLLFPLLAAVTLYGSRRSVILTGVLCSGCVAALALLRFGVEGPLDIASAGLGLLRCVAEFSLGLIAFRVAQEAGVQAWARNPLSGGLLALAIVLLMIWHGSDLAIVALLPAFIITLGVGRGPVQRLLGSPPVFFAGEISYALYLLHARFVRVRDGLDAKLTPMLGTAAPVVTCIVVWGTLLVAAYLAFRIIEKPARAHVRRLEALIPSERAAQPQLVETAEASQMEAALGGASRLPGG